MESNSVNITQADNTIVVVEPLGNTITIVESTDSSEITTNNQQFDGTIITETSITLEVADSSNTVNVFPERGVTEVNVDQPVTEVVNIATLGPQGQVGPAGPPGPSGSITSPITNDIVISGSLIVTGSSDFKNGITVTGSVLTTDKVGIGTNAPTQTLHVSSSTTDAVAKFQSSDTKAFIIIQDDGDQGFVGVQTDRLVLGTNTSFVSTDNVYIKNDGNVGIGTTSPPSKLTVQGNISSSGNITATSFQGDGSNLTGLNLEKVLQLGDNAEGLNISQVNNLSVTSITGSNISGSGRGSFGSLEVNGDKAVTSVVTQGSFSGTVIDTSVQIVAVKDDASKGTTSFYFLCQGIYYWIAQVENS